MNKKLVATQKLILLPFIVFTTVHSVHLRQTRNFLDSLETSSNNRSLLNISRNDAADNTSVKGNLGSLTNIVSNPTQIIDQIQTTLNTFLQTLNSTLSGSSSNAQPIFGSLKNITSKPSGSFRLEDADLILANISEIVKNSTQSTSNSTNDSTSGFDSQVHGAFENFRKAIQQMRPTVLDSNNVAVENSSVSPSMMQERNGNSTNSANNAGVAENTHRETQRSRTTNTFPKSLFDQISSLRAQVDSQIQSSLTNARSTLEDSLQIARRNSQVMRNQTSAFMSEVQRIFNEFSAPFRNFLNTMRYERPSAVETA